MFLLCLNASAQSVPTCSANSTNLAVHSEGLTEKVSDITMICTGGTAGTQATLNIFVTLNANITNRQDSSGKPQGIAVKVNGAPAGNFQLSAASVLRIDSLNYAIPTPNTVPVTIVISGLLAAPGTLAATATPGIVNANIVGIGYTLAAPPQLPLAVASPTLLTSQINYGIPCGGTPLPTTLDFPGFTGVASFSSAVRITEASPNAFQAKIAGADTGNRFLIQVSGYTAGTRLFLPDAIVGFSPGASPTSAGAYGTTINAGTYTPGIGQLLLLRVNGADSHGTGGTLVLPTPVATTTFGSVSEVSLTTGAGFAVYEVADSNANVTESAQIPLFLANPQTACTGTTVLPNFAIALAPVSTVTVGTQTDPIPRFISTVPGSDCKPNGDCTASYFPGLSIDSTPINLTGASLGGAVSANLFVGNSGGGILNFTTAITYSAGQAATNWLSIRPSSGQNPTSLQLFADPSALQPGSYTATVTVYSSSYPCPATDNPGCIVSVPVNFTVGQPGVTIQNVGNAASFQYGTVAPGSYAVLYGLNLSGNKVSVSFNGLPATIVYNSATQINLIVPATVGTFQPTASVQVNVDGRFSNTFKVVLAPNAPGIFANAVVNFDDGSVNDANHPVARGRFITIYMTGLAIPATGVTLNVGTQTGLIPSFAGAQGTLPALDQVNFAVPASLPSTSPVSLSVCAPAPGITGPPVCSSSVNLYLK